MVGSGPILPSEAVANKLESEFKPNLAFLRTTSRGVPTRGISPEKVPSWSVSTSMLEIAIESF